MTMSTQRCEGRGHADAAREVSEHGARAHPVLSHDGARAALVVHDCAAPERWNAYPRSPGQTAAGQAAHALLLALNYVPNSPCVPLFLGRPNAGTILSEYLQLFGHHLRWHDIAGLRRGFASLGVRLKPSDQPVPLSPYIPSLDCANLSRRACAQAVVRWRFGWQRRYGSMPLCLYTTLTSMCFR